MVKRFVASCSLNQMIDQTQVAWGQLQLIREVSFYWIEAKIRLQTRLTLKSLSSGRKTKKERSAVNFLNKAQFQESLSKDWGQALIDSINYCHDHAWRCESAQTKHFECERTQRAFKLSQPSTFHDFLRNYGSCWILLPCSKRLKIQREHFGKPIAAWQISQLKMTNMLT